MTTKPKNQDPENDDALEPVTEDSSQEKPDVVSCQCGWTGTEAEAQHHFENAPPAHQRT